MFIVKTALALARQGGGCSPEGAVMKSHFYSIISGGFLQEKEMVF